MNNLKRRFTPLFISSFFGGLIFWYPILLPFMTSRGITPAQIALSAIIGSVVGLLVEVPSGLLADRWSRKGVAIISLLSMALSSYLFATAHSFTEFVIGGIFSAIFFGMQSGMQEAMIYDALLEQDRRNDYERNVGRLLGTNAAGVAVSSLLGAFIASKHGFVVVFYMSIVSCALSLLFLMKFREPKLHKQTQVSKMLDHTKSMLRYMNKHHEMRLLVIVSVLLGVEFCFMTQLDQLWPLALGLGVVWYGPLNAFLMGGIGFASPIASRIVKHANFIFIVATASVFAAGGLLMRNIFIVGISEFMLLSTAMALKIVMSGRVQDELPSSQRSGVESALSTFSSLAFVVIAFGFSAAVTKYSVFTAAWIVVTVALASLLGVILTRHTAKNGQEL